MNHFIRHVRPSKNNKVALFLDNHSSHLSIDVLNLAKDNGNSDDILPATLFSQAPAFAQERIWAVEKIFQLVCN
jgi:hypothetical protein